MSSVNFLEKREVGGGGAYELCRGRCAFARSHIWGVDSPIDGTASFYYTPLGMLVYVCVDGLEDGVYSLKLVTESGGECVLPPLYAKNGSAWCSALTGKISACQILGGKMKVSGHVCGRTVTVAKGSIRPPRLGETRLCVAE